MNNTIRAAKQLTVDQLSSLPITKEATIVDEYLDSNRHVNVSWYLHLFNQATLGMQKWLGFNWRELKSEGASSFSLEGHIRYLAELFAGEHVTVRTRLISRSSKRLHYLHFMFNDDQQKLAATYEEIQAYMDMNKRRMAPYPGPLAARLDEVLQQHQALDWAPPICGAMQA